MAKAENLLNGRDVAYILDMSPSDVIYFARRGKLKGIKQGRFWRFRLADVEAYKKQLAKK